MIFLGAPDRVALVARGESVTFAELRQRVDRRTQELSGAPQDVPTMLEASQSIAFAVDLLGHLESRRPVALFPARSAEAELEERRRILAAPCHPEAALILFTSGSTGKARAVQLSRANIDANIDAVMRALEFEGADQQLLFLPLSYSFALLGQLLPGLRAGVTTVLMENVLELRAHALKKGLPSMLSGVPSHWEAVVRLLEHDSVDCGAVTHVISAGAPLHLELRSKLAKAFPRATIFNNYGQTELSPRVLVLRSDDPSFWQGATGHPVGNCRVRISDDGELCVSGDQVMLGYLGDPSTTDEKIQGGWLHTGDLAEQGPNGVITILGRRDQLHKVGGKLVNPVEVEEALRTIPGIAAVAIHAEEHPLYGASLTAFIEGRGSESMSRPRLVEALAQRLSSYKLPASYFQVSRLPRTENGKIARHQLSGLKREATEIA